MSQYCTKCVKRTLCSQRSCGQMRETGLSTQSQTAQSFNTREACAGFCGNKGLTLSRNQLENFPQDVAFGGYTGAPLIGPGGGRGRERRPQVEDTDCVLLLPKYQH